MSLIQSTKKLRQLDDDCDKLKLVMLTCRFQQLLNHWVSYETSALILTKEFMLFAWREFIEDQDHWKLCASRKMYWFQCMSIVGFEKKKRKYKLGIFQLIFIYYEKYLMKMMKLALTLKTNTPKIFNRKILWYNSRYFSSKCITEQDLS